MKTLDRRSPKIAATCYPSAAAARASASADKGNDVQPAQKVFAVACADCHGDDGSGGDAGDRQ